MWRNQDFETSREINDYYNNLGSETNNTSSVVEITDEQSNNNFLNKNRKAIIFFGSERCGHCKKMIPVFNRLAQTNPEIGFAHVEVSKVDVENITGVPVFVSYVNGIEMNGVVGADENKLNNLLNELRRDNNRAPIQRMR